MLLSSSQTLMLPNHFRHLRLMGLCPSHHRRLQEGLHHQSLCQLLQQIVQQHQNVVTED